MSQSGMPGKIMIILLIISGIKLYSQISPATPGLQAILFSKIFSYVRTLDPEDRINLLVVYTENISEANEIGEAFGSENFDVTISKLSEITENLKKTSIVYLVDTSGKTKLDSLFSLKNHLFISGVPELVEKGIASIGVGIEDDRPRIIINLNRLEDESHQVSSELLSLAKVIRQ